MLMSIVVGLLMAVLTITIHAVGTISWINYLRYRQHMMEVRTTFASLRVLCTTGVILLLLHIAEVAAWAIVYLFFIGGEQFTTAEEAIYFSTVTFASLGYGDVVIEGSRRLLSAIHAMIGLLVFGWSSALLFVVVQQILKQQAEADELPD